MDENRHPSIRPPFESHFFPASVGEFPAEWFGGILKCMDERPLFLAGTARSLTFRFLSLRSFGRPTMIRVERTESGWNLDAKMLDGSPGEEGSGHLIRSTQRQLSWWQCRRLDARTAKFPFWDLPYEDDKRGLDGGSWVLEGADAKRYHIIYRWECDDRRIRSFCGYLYWLRGIWGW